MWNRKKEMAKHSWYWKKLLVKKKDKYTKKITLQKWATVWFSDGAYK